MAQPTNRLCSAAGAGSSPAGAIGRQIGRVLVRIDGAVKELRDMADRLERIGSLGPDYDQFTYSISLNVFAGDRLHDAPLPAEHEAVQDHIRELAADQYQHYAGALWAMSHTAMSAYAIAAVFHAERMPPTHQGDSQ